MSCGMSATVSDRRQIAVGDRDPERPLRRPFDVDMDPLMVVGGVGELVHPFLGDLEPVRGTEVAALRGPELVQVFEHRHLWHEASVSLGTTGRAFGRKPVQPACGRRRAEAPGP